MDTIYGLTLIGVAITIMVIFVFGGKDKEKLIKIE